MDPQSQFASPYLAMGNNPVMMVDPDGEFAFLIPIAIGAVVNVASNWSAISSAGSFGKGFGMAVGYAGVGALQGASTLVGGPAGFALGGAIGGLGNGLMQGLTGSQLLASAGIGAVSGLAGGTAARHAGKLVGNLASPLLDGMAKGAVGGTAGGLVGGGSGSTLTGGNFLDGALQGAWQGAAFGAGIGGAVSSYQAAKAGFNPLTGQRTKTWLANNPPRNYTVDVERPKLSMGLLEKRQVRGNIYGADFEMALKEWNNVRQQYGKGTVSADQVYYGGRDGFRSVTLPDGSKVSGQFYYGGKTNPTGWNIKVNTIPPPNTPHIPAIHLRYLQYTKVMLQIDSSALEILKNCIGKRLDTIFSDSISFSEFEISFNDRELRMSFFNGCSFELKSEFFETDYGEMFHDYVIKENESYTKGLSDYTLNSDMIKRIEIYGRPFPIEEFRCYPDIYEEYKRVDKTDDLLMFHMANGERIMLVMHDFFPNINLYVGSRMIKGYFEYTQSEYSLHHTVY